MSNVTLTISGRDYTVACAEGEEAHVAGLGRMIDTRLSAMGNMAGQGETRQLLFAALLLADELHEAGSGRVAAAASVDYADRLEAIASALESCASHLEG
jgi:cell division protein ZapA